MRKGGAHPGIWYDPYGPFGDPDDDISMATWPSRQFSSNMSGTDCFFDPSFPPYMVSPWQQKVAMADQRIGSTSNSNRRPKDKSARQVTMALRDDQSGQILEAISPPREHSSFSHGAQDFCPTDTQFHRPPKMGALSVPVQPSSATSARRTSSSHLNSAPRTSSKQTPSDEPILGPNGPPNTKLQSAYHLNSKRANHDGHQSNKSATYSFVDHLPTPSPFFYETHRWDSDVSMRDNSSNLSEITRFERNSAALENKTDSAHVPLAAENVKSRKEGLAADTGTLPDIEVRHDQSLLPNSIANLTTKVNAIGDDSDRTPRNKPNENFSGMFASVEVIDVDAADMSLDVTTADFAKLSPFKPSHKSGMSSISSTGRLERQLYSALGEELGSFEQHIDTAGLGPETAQALSGTSDHANLGGDAVLSSTSCGFGQVKRKRKATLGGERDKSPSKKKEKARKELVEDDDIPADMPRLRGD
ncbi:hypothetical protein N0V94_007193 [Neodidymelliopsis sp. IMI 364377]|nr:hypothetical protein N0V94_007193 [Neodidymelliopsis sp. IMI 364377]